MSLITMLRSIERITQARILTIECEIILSVLENPGKSARQLFEMSSYSSTTFYGSLKRLTHAGTLWHRPKPGDRRTNEYFLSDIYATELIHLLKSHNFPLFFTKIENTNY